jgi:hypothetical protein
VNTREIREVCDCDFMKPREGKEVLGGAGEAGSTPKEGEPAGQFIIQEGCIMYTFVRHYRPS